VVAADDGRAPGPKAVALAMESQIPCEPVFRSPSGFSHTGGTSAVSALYAFGVPQPSEGE